MPAARLGAPIAALLPSWELSLAERGLSPKTTEAYVTRTGGEFTRCLAAHRLPADTEGAGAPHIRYQRPRNAIPGSAAEPTRSTTKRAPRCDLRGL